MAVLVFFGVFLACHQPVYAAGSELGLHAASLEWIDATHIRATYNWNDGNQIQDWTPTNGTTLTQNGSEIDVSGGNRVIFGMIWNLPLAVSRVTANENGLIGRYSNIYTNLDASWDGQPWDANPSYSHIWNSGQPVFVVDGVSTAYAGPSPLDNTWYDYEFQITPTSLLASSTIDNTLYSQAGTYTPTTTGRLAFGAYGASTQWKTITIEGEVSPSAIQPDTTPPVISSIASSTTLTSATITWTTDENSTSTVEYGANTSYGSASSSQSSVVSHSITLTGLTENTLYHFMVSSQDAWGNVATSSDVTFRTAATVPVTYTIVSSAGSNGAISPLGSTTVNEGGSQEYLITPDAGYGVASLLVDGSGVTTSTSYTFTNVTADHTIAAAFSDVTPPVISDVASSTGSTTSTITWTTDQASTSTVEYGTSTSYGFTSSSQSLVTSHSMNLIGLTANTVYHFRVSSQDAAGNHTSSTDYTFRTADNSISTVSSQVNPTQLVFDGTNMWAIGTGRSDGPLEKFDPQTGQSTATVYLGGYLGYGTSDGTSLWVPATTVSISKINPLTNATDTVLSIGGNISGAFYDGASTVWVPGGTDSGNTFLQRISTTSSQVYATTTLTSWLGADGVLFDGQSIWVNQTLNNSVMKVDPATNQLVATVAVGTSPARGIAFDGTSIWVANTGSNTVSKIDVATNQVTQTLSVGTYPNGVAFDGAFIWVSNRDSNTVNRIDPNRNVIVQTYSVGTNPLGMASDGTFMWVANGGSNTITRIPIVPPDLTAPVISTVTSSTTGNSATITWTTDENATSTVFYGSTTDYGSVSSSQALVTSHSITIKYLAPSAQYHFKVASQDESGNVASSTDYTFTTTVDTVSPVISEVASSSVQETVSTASATITWTTDEYASSTVEYGPTTGYGSASSSSALVSSHQIVIGGLSLDTDYHFRISSGDVSGNEATSADYVVHTALPDLVSPIVSNVASSTVQDDAFASATITWTTDEASTSTVEYGTTTGYGSASSSVILTTDHTVVIGNLDFDTTYHYRISSQDAWGNVVTTADYTFHTPHANTRSVGGTVSGLLGTLSLQNNGGDTLTLTQNGSFTFATELNIDNPYRVTVLTQPTGYFCTVLHGVGLASSNITNIVVSCANTQGGTIYEIGPGETYTNIGDFPWSSSLQAGDTVNIYPKTAITAVTASASATTTVTLTASAGAIPYGSTIWFSGLTTISPSVTCGTYGSGLYGTATGGTACSGNTVTLSDPVTVGAGVTVYFTPPYYEKLLLTAAGTTSSPITIQGIPDPVTGALPVFDPHDATTGPNMAHTGSVAYHDSYGFFVLLRSSDQTAWPTYVTLKNLRLQNDRIGAGITSYDGTNASYTYNAGSGIRFENADHVTLDGLEIVNNDNGLFGATNPDSFPAFFINSLTIRNSHFWRNGRGESNHQSYLEGDQITYEQNWYDAPANGTSCSQLKDRSSGTIIRNNLFYPSIRELDLINSQNGRTLLIPQTLLPVPAGGFAAGATSLTFASGDFSGIAPGDVVGGHPSDFNGYSIVSLAPGSPTVLTFQGYYYVNHTSPGEHFLIENAAGTGCSGLNGDQTILSVDPDNATITIDYDSTGCTYTGGSATAYGGWGYPGSGQHLVMPTIVSVDAASRTMTLDSGLPVGYSAGWDFRVIRRTSDPYFETFIYGNIFDQDYTLYPHPANAFVHYGWDTTGGDDSIFDRAGTLYFYNNTAILRGYDHQAIFQAESNADTFRIDNNLFYAEGSSYYVVANLAQYSAGATVGTFTGGNNLIVATSGIGQTTCGGTTSTGWQACPPPIDEYHLFNGSVDFSNFSTVTSTQAYPDGLPSSRDYHLQNGSTAIGAASTLPAAIASNSLGMDLTPVYEYGWAVRSSLLDVGAFEYSLAAPSSNKAITAFAFNGLSPAVTGSINESNHTVSLTVPSGTSVTSLVPAITITGASISPNTGVAQNFTNPVTYTVTAADASTQEYTVTVTVTGDATSPVVTAFTIPSTASSLTVSISSFTASDNTSVTGYLLTESSTPPASGAAGWTGSAPGTYTFSSEGSKTLYAWAKDAAGNVSNGVSASIAISLPVASSGGAGGGGGFVAISPQPLVATVPLALLLDHVEPLGDGSFRIWIKLNADPSTARGYALSTNAMFSNASLVTPYQSLVSITVPKSITPVTIYGKVYSTSGDASNLLLLSVDLSSGTQVQVSPSSDTPPMESPSGTGSSPLLSPSDLDALLGSFGLSRDLVKEDDVLVQVKADAKEFALDLTESQAFSIRNFIVYGISPNTIKLGQGERRAVVRDYMETVHRGDFVWEDIERMTTGQIPIKRNLEIERSNVSMALPVFKKIFGHTPNFKNQTENLAWNTLLYRIRFPRDLSKESQGISRYLSLFRKNPKTPFEWSIVRVLGYVK
jgi:YVTN family beta-propeller protein